MKKLLVCIDGSGYADNICKNAAWVAGQFEAAEITLLHVLPRHSDYEAQCDDHTGSIGLGARTNLLDELTKVDEEPRRTKWLVAAFSFSFFFFFPPSRST